MLSYCLQTDYMMCCLQTRITETAIPIMALPEVLSSGRLYLGCWLRLGLLRVLATCCNLPHLHRVSLKGQISLCHSTQATRANLNTEGFFCFVFLLAVACLNCVGNYALYPLVEIPPLPPPLPPAEVHSFHLINFLTESAVSATMAFRL